MKNRSIMVGLVLILGIIGILTYYHSQVRAAESSESQLKTLLKQGIQNDGVISEEEFKHMFSVACSDGVLSDEEIALLTQATQYINWLTNYQIQKLVNAIHTMNDYAEILQTENIKDVGIYDSDFFISNGEITFKLSTRWGLSQTLQNENATDLYSILKNSIESTSYFLDILAKTLEKYGKIWATGGGPDEVTTEARPFFIVDKDFTKERSTFEKIDIAKIDWENAQFIFKKSTVEAIIRALKSSR